METNWLQSLKQKFTSANGIPVSRAVITREEFEAIEEFMSELMDPSSMRPEYDFKNGVRGKYAGRRVMDWKRDILAAGQYAKDPETGIWFACTPNGHLANLKQHTVTEHPNGTITVEPSIKVSIANGAEVWHGYLKSGIWEQV